MGSVSEMGKELRKLTIVSMRTCYKSICNHPFILGMVLLMIFLNRSFPFLFSLLVSASPVLISTALLLGTLLSFGQPNIPEIEPEEKVNNDVVASFKAGISANNCAFIVERDETFVMERYVAEKSVGKTSSKDNKASNEEDHDVPVGYVPLFDDDLQEIQTQKKVIEVVGREFQNTELEKEKESQESLEEELRSENVPNNGETVENRYGYDQEIRDEILSMRVRESFGEPVEAHKKYHFNYSSMGGGDNDDEVDEDESEDSGSDRAESSSPDASMSDIMPMLDELDPLLDEESPQITQLLPDDSDVASEKSHSSDGSEELDENVENQREAGVDNDDDKEAHGGKEDESKSAIKWTEDDEKNLMDLRTLELERNQRLESLIARRRARKSFKLMAERNLIDLESSEIPFNVPPISVTRQNPFDLPFDSYDNMGLPPIPGSAPSVLLARRNPFDLPYEPNEEKPDLKGDDFEQEFSTVHQRDMVSRRYESFNIGPSSLGGPRQERQDFKWRPVFVPEGFASEGASCSSFHRQSSEVSDSKLSSVPDTDSVSSDSDSDEKKLNEPDHSKETDSVSNVSAHGSQSSEELDSLELVQAEKGNVQNGEAEIILGGLENHSEIELNFSKTGEVATDTHLELNSREARVMAGPVEGEESSVSSLSLLSEIGEKSHDVQKRDPYTSVDVKVDDIVQSSLSVQPSLEESEFQSISEVVDDSQHKEPVYDTSPPSAEKEKSLSVSSITSTMEAESSTKITPIASEEMAVMVDKQESELYSVSAEKNSSVYHEISSKARATDVFVERSIEDSETSVIDSMKVDKPTVEPCFDDHGILHEQADVLVLGTKSSSKTSGFRTIPSEGVELDLKDGILDAIVKEKKNQVHETHHPEARVALESINEDVNETTEIDEVLLSELDTVGDFSLKEVGGESLGTELTLEEANIGSAKIGLSTNHSNHKNLVLPVLEARSVEDITVAFKQLDEGTDANEVILPSLIKDELLDEESNNTHTGTSNLQEVEARSSEDIPKALKHVSNVDVSDLPVLEARLVEDVEVALNQLHDGTDVNEAILPSSSKDLLLGEVSEDIHIAGSNLDEVEARSAEDTPKALKQVSNDDVSDLPVLEARSIEDVEVALKQLHEGTDVNEVILPGLTKDLLLGEESEDTHIAGSNLDEVEARSSEDIPTALEQVANDDVSDLPVLEARSIEDVEVASKQLHEGTDVNEVILPGLTKDLLLGEESEDTHIAGSNLDEVEARSLEDIQTALKQVSNDDVSDLPVLEARSIEDVEVALKQLDEGTYVNEVILPSLSKDQLLKEEPEDTHIARLNLRETEASSLEDIHKALKQVSNDDVSNLPVLEAILMEDIDVAFKQLDEGTDVNEVILPSLIKDQLLTEDSKDTRISTSNLPEVEARSSEDIQKALKQVSNDHVSDIPILEARAIEDIDVALKQFHEGKDLNLVQEQLPKKESKDGQISNSYMQEVDAKSLEDIALKQVWDHDVNGPSKPLNCQSEEPSEGASAVNNGSGSITSVEECSKITSNELKQAVHETLEILGSSISNSTDKEEVNAYKSTSDFSNINLSSSDSVLK